MKNEDKINQAFTKLKSKIKLSRKLVVTILILIYIILVYFFSDGLLNYSKTFFSENVTSEGTSFFIFSSMSAFALFGLKNLIYEKFDKLIDYVGLSDLLKVISIEEKEKYLNNTIEENIKFSIPFTIAKNVIIISLTALISYGTWLTKENESNNLYAFNLSKNELMTENIDKFKLIFSFGHKDSIIEKYGQDEIITLTNLLRSLKGCLSSKLDTVKINIQGFASEYHSTDSKKFKDLILANNRARNAEIILENLLDSLKDKNMNHLSRVKIYLKQWKEDSTSEYERMVRARIFKEVNTEKMSNIKRRTESAEYINRRVEVTITDAGACK